MIMVLIAVARPDMAAWLLSGAVAVALVTWMGSRRPGTSEIAAIGEGEVDAIRFPASPALMDSVFEALNDPVMIISGGEADDIAGRRIVLANGAARDLLRIQREGSLLVSAVARSQCAGGGGRGPVRRCRSHDRLCRQRVPAPATGRPGSGPCRRPATGSLALLGLRDETDVRRMELMRVDFLANASHELRTPLASLSGFIETLKGHARDDAVARDRFLDIMATQAERMSRLVADLLSLSRIELNEHIPPSGRVDLPRAASDVVDAVSVLSPRTRASSSCWTTDASAYRSTATATRSSRWSRTWSTTPSNIRPATAPSRSPSAADSRSTRPWTARHGGRDPPVAADPGSRGRRRAMSPSPSATTGPGMAREHLPRLTERFYRVEGQKSGERAGTGLGLAIVKHIVNRHRGGLSVESAPGEGAIFSACFPMAARSSGARVEIAL